MPRKQSIKTLKAKAWKLFSEYIRRRDSDENGYGKCCTCGKKIHWSEGDAGHWISRVHSSTFFEETNVHLQCRYDNRYRNGAPEEYVKFMIDQYGIDELERLRLLKHQQKKFTTRDLESFIELLKEKIKGSK